YKFQETDFGSDSLVPVRQFQLEWFDQWLMGKDSALLSTPPVKIFVMGANQWRDDREWPPAGSRQQRFFLESQGHANTLDGDGALGDQPVHHKSVEDKFVFDPKDPVPTRGGAVCCNP